MIPESTTCQDQNPELVLLSLKLMNDGLAKKPFLVEETFDTTVPDVLSLLKLYKDNAEIQEAGYGVLSHYGKNKVYAASLINNGILPTIKETLENTLFSDTLVARNYKENLEKEMEQVKQDLERINKDIVTVDMTK